MINTENISFEISDSGYLVRLEPIGGGFGHFNVEVKACDNPGIYGSVLSFNMEFDQTEINKMVNQLEMIIKKLPFIGSLN